MKIAILYTSKYGSTKQYAQWLKEALPEADLYEAKEAADKDLGAYDGLIYGGWLHAGNIKGLGALKKRRDLKPDMHLLVFGVGATPTEHAAIEQLVAQNQLPGMERVQYFYLPGNMDVAKMTLGDRTMMKMLKKVLEKKPQEDREGWEKALLEGFDQRWVQTDKALIAPLLEQVDVISRDFA
ncbi:flavodoxin domain-containing protein [Eubacteriales bacterium OttesenSCG-928-M02]|nr:flavodoxin domain-containing protein [Eubacteriales bacterium OttesenSCG-928-M02]